jgi:type IV secretory pathway VirB4 component
MTLALTPHRATTRHLASCYLFQADPPIDVGPVLGTDARSGGTFSFDPFAAYAAGLITNPNLLILGEVGSGKSTVAKLLCWMERALLGRSVAILDPKGEYGTLAKLLGLPTICLTPGGKTRINPLEIAGPSILDEHHRQRLDVLGALGESGLGRPLRPEERAGLDATIGELTGAPLLGDVVNALLAPSTAVASLLRTTTGELAAASRELALALHRLVGGDLAGMFDGPSTVRLEPGGPGVHVDLSPVYTNPAVLAPTMVAAGSWLTASLATPGSQHLLVLDETWQVLADPGVGRWLRSTMKLARALGAAVVLVTHSLADFRAVGDERSEAARLAASLVADTASRALLAHSDASVRDTASALELTETEAEVLPHLGRGVALWHVGEHARLVRHRVPSALLAALDTDAAMLGRTERGAAQ